MYTRYRHEKINGIVKISILSRAKGINDILMVTLKSQLQIQNDADITVLLFGRYSDPFDYAQKRNWCKEVSQWNDSFCCMSRHAMYLREVGEKRKEGL